MPLPRSTAVRRPLGTEPVVWWFVRALWQEWFLPLVVLAPLPRSTWAEAEPPIVAAVLGTMPGCTTPENQQDRKVLVVEVVESVA